MHWLGYAAVFIPGRFVCGGVKSEHRFAVLLDGTFEVQVVVIGGHRG